MSWAGVTFAVLPEDVAHFAAASFTALVSASPEEAIRTWRLAGPVDCCFVPLLSLSSKPLPQAPVAIRAPATTAARSALRFITISKEGSRCLAEDEGGPEQDLGGQCGGVAVEHAGEQVHAARRRLGKWLADAGQPDGLGHRG